MAMMWTSLTEREIRAGCRQNLYADAFSKLSNFSVNQVPARLTKFSLCAVQDRKALEKDGTVLRLLNLEYWLESYLEVPLKWF